MKRILVLMAFMFSANFYAQEFEQESAYEMSEVTELPEYQGGGSNRFTKYMMANYRPPDVEGLTGVIFVAFIVEVDGTVKAVRVLRDVGYGSGKDITRIIKKSPKWRPAMKDGIPVKCIYKLTINIKVASE